MLQKQVYVYNVDTSDFFTDDERQIYNAMHYYKKIRSNIIKIENIINVKNQNLKCIEKAKKITEKYKNSKRKSAVKRIKKLQNMVSNKKIELIKSNIQKLENIKENMLKNINTEHIDKAIAIIKKYNIQCDNIEETKNNLMNLISEIQKTDETKKELLESLNKVYNQLNALLKDDVISENKRIRTLNEERIKDHTIIKKGKTGENDKEIKITKKVAVFDSFLTRTLGIETGTTTEDIFIIDVYYYNVLEQLIENGFYFKNRKYKFFTSSAGQIRDKKIVSINKEIFEAKEKTLLCGLSIDRINETVVNEETNEKGCNITKFLAYEALTMSATDEFKGFDIDECIVVDDFSTKINEEVNYIDTENFTITPTKEDIEITHTDGCGMCLPETSKKAFVFRAPWLKGLIVPFDFVRFINEHEKAKHIVKDIYDDEWNILTGECLTNQKASGKPIKYIFTKSMFKMCKYYDNWQEYKEAFKKYGCTAGICSRELAIEEYKDKQMPYQMLQTLDLTDDEIKAITKKTLDFLKAAHTDIEAMKQIINAGIKNRNAFQQAFELYPEIIKDPYFKQVLQDTIASKRKQAKAGKIEIAESRYVFIAPDLYAFCEWLFCNTDKPEGLLKEGEMYCKLYNNNQKLDVCRNPHLSFEHAVRINNLSEKAKKWFDTTCIYTSIHDSISKILQFDVDGDIALVIAEPVIVQAAERKLKEKKIRPLFYKMAKASAEQISEESIYASLKKAFEYGGKIGEYSNMISILWNKENRTEEDENLIKILTALTNFSIDAAKTKYMPKLSPELEKKINKLSKEPLPYFFKYAKNKNENKVAKINNSTVNRICRIFEEQTKEKYTFPATKFYYKFLMNNPKIKVDEKVIQLYQKLDNRKNEFFRKNKNAEREAIQAMYADLRQEFIKEFSQYKIKDIVDMLLVHLKGKAYKTLLWEIFGFEIVKNIRKNLSKIKIMRQKQQNNRLQYINCIDCGKEIIKQSNAQKYCSKCAKKHKYQKSA